MRWTALLLCLAGCATLRPHADARDVPLRVMTYNIQSGRGDLAGTAAAIRATGAEIVALQEVDVHWADRSAFVDQAAELARTLGMEVRFAPIYHVVESGKPPREFGVALLSRHRITSFRNDTLTRLSTQEREPAPTRMPGLLDATLDVRGTAVRVFDTHLDYRSDPRVRATQVREMLAYLDASNVPTLVFGDMNATPDAAELRPLRERLQDAWSVGSGAGFTYPAEAPAKRIDYVFASRHFRVRAAVVPATQASDHRPVVVDLSLVNR